MIGSPPNVSLPVDTLYPISIKFYQLERLWTTGTIGLFIREPVDDSMIRGKLVSIIDDLQNALKTFDQTKENQWLS